MKSHLVQGLFAAALAAGVALAAVAAVGVAAVGVAHGAEPFTLEAALEDSKLYVTAPLRWDGEDWAFFGAALAVIAAAHSKDGKVREHFAVGDQAALNGGEDKHALRDAIPTLGIVAGTGFYAGFIRDKEGYGETWSLLEAGVFSSATAEILSLAAGRERPDGTTSPNQWREGGDSFPSLHSSAAFAVGTVFAESGNDEYRWIRRLIGYGVAAGTSYIRVRDNAHWLSDSVAGAALGIATARFVLNRRDTESPPAVQFQPVKDGWMLAYCLRTR